MQLRNTTPQLNVKCRLALMYKLWRLWCEAAAPQQDLTCTLLRLSTTLASSLVRSDRGSLNTPPSLPLCRSLEGPRTCGTRGVTVSLSQARAKDGWEVGRLLQGAARLTGLLGPPGVPQQDWQQGTAP